MLRTVGGEYSYKKYFIKEDSIVRKIQKRFLFLILAMVAFCAIMLFGIFRGDQHPQIFFWSLMAFFAAVIVIIITPTMKDAAILIVGMLILAAAGQGVDMLLDYLHMKDTLLGFIISLVLLAPFYFPLFIHFMKMCRKSVIRMKQEYQTKSESK